MQVVPIFSPHAQHFLIHAVKLGIEHDLCTDYSAPKPPHRARFLMMREQLGIRSPTIMAESLQNIELDHIFS